jgi:hypothetical protein
MRDALCARTRSSRNSGVTDREGIERHRQSKSTMHTSQPILILTAHLNLNNKSCFALCRVDGGCRVKTSCATVRCRHPGEPLWACVVAGVCIGRDALERPRLVGHRRGLPGKTAVPAQLQHRPSNAVRGSGRPRPK